MQHKHPENKKHRRPRNDDHKIEINIVFKMCAFNFIQFGACKLCALGNGNTSAD